VKLEVSEQDRRSRIRADQAGEVVAKARPRPQQRRFEGTFGKEAAVELRAVLKDCDGRFL
jgi:hypothetical protein